MARRFYLSEAESLLPQVGEWIREAVSLKSECQEADYSDYRIHQRRRQAQRAV